MDFGTSGYVVLSWWTIFQVMTEREHTHIFLDGKFRALWQIQSCCLHLRVADPGVTPRQHSFSLYVVNWESNWADPSNIWRRTLHISDFSLKSSSWYFQPSQRVEATAPCVSFIILIDNGIFYSSGSCVCWPWPTECFIAWSWCCEDLLCSV